MKEKERYVNLFSFLLPIITIIILFIYYKKKIHLVEYLILFFVPLLLIVLMKLIFTRSVDSEIWGEYIKQVRYYEDWNEYIHRTCTNTYTDANGNTQTTTYDCSYVQYHGEYYEAISNTGNEYYISKNKYEFYKRLWKNSKFQDMKRNYHSNDGDMYYSNWDNIMDNMFVYFTEHYYENKVIESNSIFKFEEIDTSFYKDIYEYPELIDNKIDAYLYDKSLISNEILLANESLIKWNAFLGAQLEIRMMVLIWKNKIDDYAWAQRNFWQNGNKNELIVCISIDDNMKIQWADIISWTEVEELKIQLRSDIYDLEYLDYSKLNELIKNKSVELWKRKEFKDFNYLTVEPKTWQLILSYIIVFITCLVIALISIKNDADSNFFNK